MSSENGIIKQNNQKDPDIDSSNGQQSMIESELRQNQEDRVIDPLNSQKSIQDSDSHKNLQDEIRSPVISKESANYHDEPDDQKEKIIYHLKNQQIIENYNNLIYSNLMIMLRFAVERGIELPNTINISKATTNEDVVDIHNIVSKTIEPATVRSIKFIDNDILDVNNTDVSIPIFSKCQQIAGLALVALILLSLFECVNTKIQEGGMLNNHGWELLVNLTFICAASLLGVMFYLLKTISKKIKNYSLLPVDAIDLDTTILIGIMSGFIMSELVYAQLIHPLIGVGVGIGEGGAIEMQKMTAALLGGFASDAIFTMLQSIVNNLVSITEKLSFFTKRKKK